jgi:hypothetical protein
MSRRFLKPLDLSFGRSSGGSPPFDPSTLSPVVWLAADDLTTLFQSSAGTTPVTTTGQVVGDWKDKSAAAFDFKSSSDDTTRPTWNTSGGVSWVAFDGINDGMLHDAAQLYAAGAATVSFMVRGNPTAGAYLFAELDTVSANDLYVPHKSNATTLSTDSVFIRNLSSISQIAEAPTAPHVEAFTVFDNTDHCITFVDSGSNITIYKDGVLNGLLPYVRSGTFNMNRTTLGFYNRTSGSNWFAGRIYNLVATKTALTSAQVKSLATYQMAKAGATPKFPTPLIGSHSILPVSNTFIDAGANLAYERTQAWTAIATIKTSYIPLTAAVIATNVTTSPAFRGIDFLWIDVAEKLHVRLINNIVTPLYIGVSGSTILTDGMKHTVGATYDGSSTAAGVKLYVDGVLETNTVESDTLGANSIVSGVPRLYIGNQQNHLDFQFGGIMDGLRISNIVRNQAYMTANAGGNPAVDANTVLAYDFEEGTGLTTLDLSASGFNGTLSTSAIWV